MVIKSLQPLAIWLQVGRWREVPCSTVCDYPGMPKGLGPSLCTVSISHLDTRCRKCHQNRKGTGC